MTEIFDSILKIGILVFLALLNGFFTACSFAIVKIRETRIIALAEKGDFRAKAAHDITRHLDNYLSATQLGNVVSALALGWVGEPYVTQLLYSVFSALYITSNQFISVISTIIGFSFLVFLNIILGELAPKSLAIQRTEIVTLWVAIPLKGIYYLFYPAIYILNGTANGILRLLKLPPVSENEQAHSPDELRMILNASHASGQLSIVGTQIMQRVLIFTTRTAKDIMVPKTNILALEIHAKTDEILELAFEGGYSRMPVYDTELDNILGIVYIKDFIAMEEHRSLIHLTDIIRPAYFIPESIKVGQLLREFQRRKIHMAIVVDEYGINTGLVTLEDVIEEIVGEIQDEYDMEEDRIQKLKDGTLIVDGTMSIYDLTQYYNIRFPESKEFESVSGFVLSRLGKIPTGGEIVRYDGQIFTVVDVESHRIQKVKITPADKIIT